MVTEVAAAHGVRLLPALDPALLPCKEPELVVQVLVQEQEKEVLVVVLVQVVLVQVVQVALQVRAMEEDRNDSPIPPLPDTLGYRMPQQVGSWPLAPGSWLLTPGSLPLAPGP